MCSGGFLGCPPSPAPAVLLGPALCLSASSVSEVRGDWACKHVVAPHMHIGTSHSYVDKHTCKHIHVCTYTEACPPSHAHKHKPLSVHADTYGQARAYGNPDAPTHAHTEPSSRPPMLGAVLGGLMDCATHSSALLVYGLGSWLGWRPHGLIQP